MSEFKVGDRVRVKDIEFEGIVDEVLRMEIPNYVGSLQGGTFYNSYRVISEDKYYTGLEEDMLELIERPKTINLEILQELEQRIEKLEKCVMGEQNSLEKCENVSSMSKNGLLTEDERVILRSIPKKYNWIVRDKDLDLYVFEERPYQDEKDYFYWKSSNAVDGDYFGLFFNSMFMGIERDILYNIEELLKGECEE